MAIRRIVPPAVPVSAYDRAPRCEDFPCCGHEPGGCPSRTRDGAPVYRCECGAVLGPGSRSSYCRGCLAAMAREAW